MHERQAGESKHNAKRRLRSCYRCVKFKKLNYIKMKLIFIFALTFLFMEAYSQEALSLSKFKKDITICLDKSFDEQKLNDLLDNYYEILTPQSYVSVAIKGKKEENSIYYPLFDFKNGTFYKENITKLIDSKNQYQRIIAYMLIGSSNDLSKEEVVLKRLDKKQNKEELIWCGLTLLHLQSKHTTLLFDFLVENEEWGDAHMVPFYLSLDKDSMQATSYKRYKSDKVIARILAIQTFMQTGNNPKTEKIILEAIKEWDMNRV